ncbi:hypothetical protein [Streptomyces sp. NPDC046712]|uniref:hypothetical protein n=1 Tax=Streptomyces sp. NPDC046712 TaxID=3154802 RepID=UPI0033CF7DDC
MLMSHAMDHAVLRVTLHRELEVTNRAAVALQIQALVHAHRPAEVIVELPTADPSPATLSAIARTRRMCQSIGVPLTLTGAAARARRLYEADTA